MHVPATAGVTKFSKVHMHFHFSTQACNIECNRVCVCARVQEQMQERVEQQAEARAEHARERAMVDAVMAAIDEEDRLQARQLFLCIPHW